MRPWLTEDAFRERLCAGRQRLVQLTDEELVAALYPALSTMLEAVGERRGLPPNLDLPIALSWLIAERICLERSPRVARARERAGKLSENLLRRYAEAMDADVLEGHLTPLRWSAKGHKWELLNSPRLNDALSDLLLIYLSDPHAAERKLRACGVQYFDCLYGLPKEKIN